MSTPSSDSSKVRSYSNFGRAAQRIAAAAAVSGAIWYVATTRKKRRQLSAKNDADYFPINVGNLHTPVDTVVAAAQTWFDRGIAWTSNYHREEADYCFRMATKADPKCAMAFWGIALVNGPDYNFHLDTGFYDVAKQPSGYPSLNVANTAARTAEKMSRVTNWQGKPAHRALIEAMVTRYEWPVTDSTPDLQKDYLKSMRAVAERHPDDPLVAVCHAEAALTMTPWKLYDPVPGFTLDQGAPGDGRTPNKFGLEGAKAIDHGLRLSPNNHWLAHLKIHYNEMGPLANFDWQTANMLRDSQTMGNYELGHLLHMPTHLDIQVGDYQAAMDWNIRAYKADKKLYEFAPQRFNIYVGYLIHNLEFCAWAAMYGGNFEKATYAVDRIERYVTEDLIASSERVASVLELYRVTRIMMLIRFGKWDAILRLKFYDNRHVFRGNTLFLHYARGIAYGVKSMLEEARREQSAFEALFTTIGRGERVKHNVDLFDMGGIASAILDAEIKYRANQFHGPDGAFESARRAVVLFDALPYDEPHGWLMSPRQTLGALLAEQGEIEEAVGVYRQDLHLFPNNIWSLVGLRRCLRHSKGQPLASVASELEQVESALSDARKVADIKIGASCACALEHWNERSRVAAELAPAAP